VDIEIEELLMASLVVARWKMARPKGGHGPFSVAEHS